MSKKDRGTTIYKVTKQGIGRSCREGFLISK